jgi:hypothetical protein
MIPETLAHLAISIDSIQPHPRNVRQGDVGAISESLKHNGQYRPIVVQKSTGHILAGNHTYKAARALKWKQIAATFVDVDDEQALRILLVDNRANDLATYDDSALAEILKALMETDAQLTATGFDPDDLNDILFRLEGSLGFVGEGKTINDLTDAYNNADIRNLSLPYDRDQIEEIKNDLQNLMKKLDARSFSEVVWTLVKKAL